jgi:Protein of unknown function (DUF2934)
MDKGKEREQRIRERAYRIWLDEGQPEGCDKEHWQEAEKQIIEEEQRVAPPLAGPYDNIS